MSPCPARGALAALILALLPALVWAPVAYGQELFGPKSAPGLPLTGGTLTGSIAAPGIVIQTLDSNPTNFALKINSTGGHNATPLLMSITDSGVVQFGGWGSGVALMVGPVTTPLSGINTVALQINGASITPTLSATSASIGGSSLLAGACSTTATTVTGATVGMAVVATPNTYPGAGNLWSAYVSAADTVTTEICATIASTPTASTYNLRVIQ